MPVMDRYIVRSIAASVLLVMTALLTLLALFLFINEQGWVGVGGYGNLQALRFVLFHLPTLLFQFLPVAVLIGSLLALGALARNGELTVFRAAGVSIARLGWSVFLAGLLAVPVGIAAGEYLGPPLTRLARIHKAVERNGEISLAGRSGAWVRDGNLILRARASGSGPSGVEVYEIGAGNRLASVGRGGITRELDEHQWELGEYAYSRFAAEQVGFGLEPAHRLQTRVSPAFFSLIVADPRDLSLRELWRTKNYLEANGQEARAFRFSFWSGIARLFAIPLAALLALPVVCGSRRLQETGARATLGLVLGLAWFILQRVVESGTIALGLQPMLLAWLPTVLLLAAVALLFARLRIRRPRTALSAA
jgi:lipopolysaccharide export system permease protein